jgi:hypothetical protein
METVKASLALVFVAGIWAGIGIWEWRKGDDMMIPAVVMQSPDQVCAGLLEYGNGKLLRTFCSSPRGDGDTCWESQARMQKDGEVYFIGQTPDRGWYAREGGECHAEDNPWRTK